ncbi:hypothetical protein [Streptomyces spirodelae]|uniref:Tetratricopeptide repeat protein n=1 Tax=Streptomyces spirodelae TaxID=2812904 RepID=A0ABS3WX03_9ACTN|nr:hypothetical protein [Streptomyces spirodelae]MBO8187660.1 hypothetical protein [Streptomyces spirodelae]
MSVPGVGSEGAGDGVLVMAGVGGGLMDVGVVVAGLGGVSWPGALAGTGGDAAGSRGGVGVVELVGPVDPQMVLARVRLVAGVSGQLLVVIVGELRKDPRKGGLHIGLGAPGQHSAAVRYSGLPWEWLIGELAMRPPRATTVMLDVATEPGTWESIQTGGLPEAPGVSVFGRVVRQGRGPRWRRLRGGSVPVEPTYLQECVRVWRAGGRLPFAELHERAAAVSGTTESEQALFVSSASAAFPAPSQYPAAAPVPAAGTQPVPQAALAQHNGWEHQPQPDLPADWQRENHHPPHHAQAPDQYAPHAPAPASYAPQTQAQASAAAVPENGAAAPHQPASPPHAVRPPAAGAAPADASPTAPATAASSAVASLSAEPSAAPAPAARPPAEQPPAPRTSHAQPAEDPHETIMAAARAGRHEEAEALAAAWEDAAERAEGPDSEGALHWVEVRADLARLAGDPARSCELWLRVARGRLERGEAENAMEVEGAVDRAHHQWQCLEDGETARELAPELVLLRRRVPGRQPGAVRLVEERAERLLGGVEQ